MIILVSTNSPNWLALPQPAYRNKEFLIIFFSCFKKPPRTERLDMLEINKSTAAKLIVLWNLPALLLLASAYEVGSTVFS